MLKLRSIVNDNDRTIDSRLIIKLVLIKYTGHASILAKELCQATSNWHTFIILKSTSCQNKANKYNYLCKTSFTLPSAPLDCSFKVKIGRYCNQKWQDLRINKIHVRYPRSTGNYIKPLNLKLEHHPGELRKNIDIITWSKTRNRFYEKYQKYPIKHACRLTKLTLS